VCRITIVQQHANQASGQQLIDVMKLIMGNYSSHQMSRNLSHKMSPVKALQTLTVKPPANGKLHQTRKLAATAAAQSVVETGFQLHISRDKIHFRFVLLFFFFSFCCRSVHLVKASSCLLLQASATAYYSQLKTKTLLRLKEKKTMERRNRILSIRTLP